jgi:hypothetical protein
VLPLDAEEVIRLKNEYEELTKNKENNMYKIAKKGLTNSQNSKGKNLFLY